MSESPADKFLVDHYTISLGSGGSLRIPKDWREFFGEDRPVKVLLLPSSGPSVWMFAERDAEALRAIEQRTPPDEEVAKFLAQFGKSCEMVLTSKYALSLSAGMRCWLGICRQAVLIG